MAQVSIDPWATARDVLSDGGVTFTCSRDIEAWPWLELDPHDPIVIQTINFWASYQAGEARGGWEPGQWTALTWMEWKTGERGCGHATHGVEDVFEREGEHFFRLTFFDDAGALVARMTGKGVVFRNRDFEGWRAKQKAEVGEASEPPSLEYLEATKVGASTANGSLLGALSDNSAKGLITAENGLAPGNPHLSGSGDHVNATHLAEVVRQFDTALRGGEKRLPVGGEMQFSRYVELGVPFDVTLTSGGPNSDHIAAEVHQSGKLCTTGRFNYS